MTLDEINEIREEASDRLEGPEGFREWIEDQEPGSVVGHSRTCGGCPLAMYLSETLDVDLRVDGVYVSLDLWGAVGPCVRLDLFKLEGVGWPVRFLSCVDSNPSGQHHCEVPVTRETALECLAQACAALEVTP